MKQNLSGGKGGAEGHWGGLQLCATDNAMAERGSLVSSSMKWEWSMLVYKAGACVIPPYAEWITAWCWCSLWPAGDRLLYTVQRCFKGKTLQFKYFHKSLVSWPLDHWQTFSYYISEMIGCPWQVKCCISTSGEGICIWSPADFINLIPKKEMDGLYVLWYSKFSLTEISTKIQTYRHMKVGN